MPKSRVLAVLSLFLFAVVLTACGGEDPADPTAEPTVTRDPAPSTIVAGTTERADVAPTATERATPTLVATPAVVERAEDTVATPVTAATATAQATPAVASPVAEDVSTPVTATLVLDGTEQVDYVITQDGCVGLGEWRSLKTGTQVIVRDADGAVVDIATLEAGEDGCSWVADITAPGSEFVSISIPMVTEVWFDQSELESGEVEITLP